MQAIAEILGKKILVEWSVAADKAMNTLSSPLLVEMELYFSCLIRKALRFNKYPDCAGLCFRYPLVKIAIQTGDDQSLQRERG